MYKKICLFVVLLCMPFTSFGQGAEVIYIKGDTNFRYDIEKDIGRNILLGDGYMVLKVKEVGNYSKVVLTDGKTGFISRENIYTRIPEYYTAFNSGVIISPSDLKLSPNENAKNLGRAQSGDMFFVHKMRIQNGNWIEVKFITGNQKNKIGYVRLSDSNLSCVNNTSYNIFTNYFQIPLGFFELFDNFCNTSSGEVTNTSGLDFQETDLPFEVIDLSSESEDFMTDTNQIDFQETDLPFEVIDLSSESEDFMTDTNEIDFQETDLPFEVIDSSQNDQIFYTQEDNVDLTGDDFFDFSILFE